MQIGLASPAQTRLSYPTRRATNSAYCRSPLNPLTRPSSSASVEVLKGKPLNESIHHHLSNLNKLITQNKDLPVSAETDTSSTGTAAAPATSSSTGKGFFFERLNLGRNLWKAKAAVEEMSPRNLNRLQRLLSKSPEYSPRNNLDNKWREYHGSNDWIGLLDPLDENLRREVVRYGEFVQAAYHAFHTQPTTSSCSDTTSLPSSSVSVALPDRSYKVTKNLYATSSITVPHWVDEMAPDLGWMTQRSSWIGYVAVCDDKREIARMGRRDIVIALRGTSTCLEWAENFRESLVDLPLPTKEPYSKHDPIPKVECGFLSLYKTRASSTSPSLSETVLKEIRRLIQLYKGETLSISITGHSLGAALALLVADELSSNISNINIPMAVFSFGGPRVGNKGFVNHITQNGVKVLRVVNSQDVITRVPGMLLNETLDEKLSTSGLLQQWAYSHVGSELRVDTKMSPYLKPNADVACCHDLEAYLHLVDGFLASNCPFRANAKRSLATLLDQQGSNVKKLYTKNVHAHKLANNHNHKEGVPIPNNTLS